MAMFPATLAKPGPLHRLRVAAVSVGLVIATSLFAAGSAAAQTLPPEQVANLHFRSVRVDASALAVQVSPAYARRVEALVTPRTAAIYADRIAAGDRHAPTLVLRIDSLTLNGSGGFSRRRGANRQGEQNDYLEGEGLVIAPGGAVVARYPILSALSSNYGDSAQLFGDDRNRISNIGWHFASWVRRNMGL